MNQSPDPVPTGAPRRPNGRRFTPEIIMTGLILAGSVLGLVFMSSMVAAPKLLFGRALTAIAPNLFPQIVLAAMAGLSAIVLIPMLRARDREPFAGLTTREWQRGLVFFAIMTLYALTMQPFGFLISSALALTLISLHMGNRSVLQIVIVSILGPILLYLAATRLLAVSLPELNVLELAYSRLLGE